MVFIDLLAAMLVIFVATIHLPKVIGGDQIAMISVLKDLGLASCAMILSGIFEKEEVRLAMLDR